jgi:hypothetical protein
MTNFFKILTLQRLEYAKTMDLNIRDFHNDNEVYPILFIIWVVAYIKSLRQRHRNVHLPREWWIFPRSSHRWTAMYNNVY